VAAARDKQEPAATGRHVASRRRGARAGGTFPWSGRCLGSARTTVLYWPRRTRGSAAAGARAFAADDAGLNPRRRAGMGFRPSLRKRRVFSGQGMWKSVLAISIGAALGALLRWQFGIRLNSLFPTVPPGTLVANLVGAYLIGLAVAFFTSFPAISPEWRLLIITGFCGGLTTFSTFSAELTLLLQQGRLSWALAAAAAHVVGSVLMTFAGMATVVWAQGSR